MNIRKLVQIMLPSVLLLLLSLLTVVSSTDLTLASCKNDTVCSGDRRCVNLSTDELNFFKCAPQFEESCFCFVTSPNFAPCESLKEATPSPTPDPNCFYACTSEVQCPSDTRCSIPEDDTFGGFASCLNRCEGSSDCEDGEVCGILPFGDKKSACMDKETVEARNIERVGVCIDADLLEHMDHDELVFGHQHRTAWVLCDENGSCATPGHMVVWHGHSMKMETYCAGRCQWKVTKVNSPKYRLALRVSSHTHGLEFTTFAAKYETRAEEAVLATLVRIGL